MVADSHPSSTVTVNPSYVLEDSVRVLYICFPGRTGLSKRHANGYLGMAVIPYDIQGR